MNSGEVYCPVCMNAGCQPWSEAMDYEYFSVPQKFLYHYCIQCQTIFLSPPPVELLGKIYPSNYYSFVTKKKNIVFRFKEWLDRNYFKKLLRKIQSPEIKLLDIGGGTGWLADLLKKTDPRISHSQVVDIDSKARELAEKNGHDYFEGTIEEFETEKKFQLILMLNLVEHVADPLRVLQKASELLAPGGIILVKTPNNDSLDARLFRKSYWGGLHCPRHWVIFSERSFRLLSASTNLKIKQLNYTQGAPFWSFSVLAALYRKRLVRISANRPIIFHWLFAPLSALFALFDFIRSPFAKTSQMFIVLGH